MKKDGNRYAGTVVLILIVMDNGLLQAEADFILSLSSVLILIVMDNGLLPVAVLTLKEPAKKS